MRSWSALVMLAACADAAEPELATTQQPGTISNIAAAADTSINSQLVLNANGAGAMLSTGNDYNGAVLRSLVRFDLPSTFPGLANRATVTSVTFTLRVDAQFFADPEALSTGTLTAYPLAQSWVEGTAAGLVHVQDGAPCATNGGGATWDTSNCATAWTSGGPVLFVPATASVSSVVDGAPVTFSNGQLIATVQEWLDGTTPNNGWRINSDTEEFPMFYDHLQAFYPRQHPLGPKLSFDYSCKAGFADTGSGCSSCDATAQAACVVTSGGVPTGNTCIDPGAPSTSYACSCSGTGYSLGPGATSCVDTNECLVNPCDDNGDSAATCTDHVAPSTGHDCACSAGFVANGGSCVDACLLVNPCNDNGDATATCTPSTPGVWSCNCDAGYQTTGGTHPTCQDFNACNAGGNTACAVAASGNSCADLSPPSTSYACTCNASGYALGSGPACVNANACAVNHCDDNGDTGATCLDDAPPGTGYSCTCTAGYSYDGTTCTNIDGCVTNHCDDNGDTSGTCVDQAPPGTSYTCTCGTGYSFDGTSCSNSNACATNPCDDHGDFASTCTDQPPPGTSYTCTCSTGFHDDGISCQRTDACDVDALARCATTIAGNVCVNSSLTFGYTCECGADGYTDGVLDGHSACVDRNNCLQNPCDDGGDPLATCTDHALPNGGYDCTCSPGWTLGAHAGHGSCIDKDECADQPCGSGTCHDITSGGGYACECDRGYQSTGGVAPTCQPAVTSLGDCSVAADPRAPIAVVLFGFAFARRRRRAR